MFFRIFPDKARGKRYKMPLERVDVVVARMLYKVRNVWHDRSFSYWGDFSYNPNISSAKLLADKMRNPGTYFKIKEVPGLLFSGENGQLVVIDFYDNDPFSDFQLKITSNKAIDKKPSFNEIMKNFAPDSIYWTEKMDPENSIGFWFSNQIQEHNFVKRSTEFNSWISCARGSRAKMGWIEIGNDVSAKSALKIARGIYQKS